MELLFKMAIVFLILLCIVKVLEIVENEIEYNKKRKRNGDG